MFANPEDWARHALLRAISLNRTLSDPSVSADLSDRGAWLKTEAELSRHFPDCPTRSTGPANCRRCRYRIPIGERTVAPGWPITTTPWNGSGLAYAGADAYGTIAPVTRDRLEHELAIIGPRGSPTTSWW